MTEPLFSDQELLPVDLFGHLQRHFQQKARHRYVQAHWGAWFCVTMKLMDACSPGFSPMALS